jgi:drug/metabolite transporter (DMT)-like permease
MAKGPEAGLILGGVVTNIMLIVYDKTNLISFCTINSQRCPFFVDKSQRCRMPKFIKLSPGVQLMLLSTIAYMGVNTCVKQLSHLPTHEVIFFRAVTSLVMTLGYLWHAGVRPILGHRPSVLALRGVAGVGALFFYFYTLQHIPMATAVTIQYLNPIFTAILAFFFLQEKMKLQRWLYFLVSFCGVVLVKGVDSRLTAMDILLGIAGALCAGMAYNFIRKASKKEHAMVIILYFPLVATPVTGLACFFDWVAPVGFDWIWLLLLGLCTQLGQVWATYAIQNEALNKITYLNYLGVLYALLIGFFFYGETYDIISLCGMVLVIVGVVLNLIDQDKRRRLKVLVMKRIIARK